MTKPRYSTEPDDAASFTGRFDRIYTSAAGIYNVAVRHLPVWKTWLAHALPHVCGPRVLEVSFGTGYLLTQFPPGLEVHGVDINERMIAVAQRNLERSHRTAPLCRADVARLPYGDASFDCLVNTMALSGYPRAGEALTEMRRVLRPDGRLVLLDVGFPADGNRLGSWLARGWQWSGDLVRDTATALVDAGFKAERREIGGYGSVQLFVAAPA